MRNRAPGVVDPVEIDNPVEVLDESAAIKLPVLYVPGFLSSLAVGWSFERAFKRAGYDFRCVTFPRLATGDMVEMAQDLRSQVEALAGQYLRVNIVCHSAGGLITRYFIQKLSRGAAVSSVVFLGTPHQGTVSAYPAFLSRACRQMSPGSRFMQELDTGGLGRILTRRSLSIYSNHDLLVLPSESGRLAGGRNLLLRGPLGHAMPLDPRAFAATLAFIEEMAPA